MPNNTPDAIAQVKKGFRSLLHRKSRSGNEGAGSDQISVVSPPGHSAPVEAPVSGSVKTPQLTTSIPGSSLGPETHHAGEAVEEEEEEDEAQKSPSRPVTYPTSGMTYAEGMSATSGPLGGSLEEIEEFEKQAERRSSVKSEDAVAATAAMQEEGRIGEPGSESSGTASQKAAGATTKVEESGGPARTPSKVDPIQAANSTDGVAVAAHEATDKMSSPTE